jgi:hypothetical protein
VHLQEVVQSSDCSDPPFPSSRGFPPSPAPVPFPSHRTWSIPPQSPFNPDPASPSPRKQPNRCLVDSPQSQPPQTSHISPRNRPSLLNGTHLDSPRSLPPHLVKVIGVLQRLLRHRHVQQRDVDLGGERSAIPTVRGTIPFPNPTGPRSHPALRHDARVWDHGYGITGMGSRIRIWKGGPISTTRTTWQTNTMPRMKLHEASTIDCVKPILCESASGVAFQGEGEGLDS